MSKIEDEAVPVTPWDRWPSETDREWELFQGFLTLVDSEGRELERGILARYIRSVDASSATVKRAAKAKGRRPSWLERAQAWAEEHAYGRPTVAEGVEVIRGTEAAERARTGPDGVILPRAEVEELMADHARMWSFVRRLAMSSLLKKIERGEELTAKEALSYADLATKNERLAAGRSTGRVEVDLSGMSDEALEELEKAVAAAERK